MSTYEKILSQSTFSAPESWRHFRTIEMHTAGEPLRVILDGYPDIEGGSILERVSFLKKNHDHLRTALMFEPRGHADMYGCVLTPPTNPNSDFGIIFLHNEGYSSMCGHATIAITRLVVEMGWVEKQEPTVELRIDAPCGLIKAFADIEDGEVINCRFHCVPSFIVGRDLEVNLPGYGNIKYDIAFGGAFYVYIDASQFEVELDSSSYSKLIELGRDIKNIVADKDKSLIKHPFEDDLSFLYGTIFIGPAQSSTNHSRNVCVFADGEVDRSPTGSGVSGRMAIHHSRSEIGTGEQVRIESILGTTFTGQVLETVDFGPHKAVIPEVGGMAHIVGSNNFWIDPNDPLKDGFILR